MTRTLFLILLLIFPAAAHAARTLLVFGDSLSAAFGIEQKAGWPALLAERIGKSGWRVVNLSISGETTQGGAYRIDEALARHRPAVVILELGANDGLRGLPVREAQANLDRIIRASKAVGARVMLVGMRLPPNYGPAYARQFEGMYSTLARQHKLALLPFMFEGFGSQPGFFLPDGLHPTAAAQSRVLENILPVLRPLLN